MPLRLFGRAWLALLLLSASPAKAGTVPLDSSGFTAFLAKAYAAALPEANIKVTAPLRLEVVLPSGANIAYLDNLWQHCQQRPDDCDTTVAERVANFAASIREAGEPASRRAVIRPVTYVQRLRTTGGATAGAAPVAKLLAGDLWILCVNDTPHGVEYLRLRDLTALKLDADQAIALAAKNLQATLRPLDDVAARVPHKSVGHIGGDFYDSSRILLHDDWAPVARKLKGELIVAVPMPDLVLYTNAAAPDAVAALRIAAQDVIRSARKPLSATVLKWTATGWDVVQP